MSTCLGLYVENNIIKYAKVSKERDILKVDAFGIKFYDKIGEAIGQIITETNSFKTPISINLSEEIYNYFNMFSLLNKNDLKRAVETEFESICEGKETNANAFESKYVLINSLEDKDKIKAIHVAANKNDINRKIQQLEGYKLSTISPVATSIANIANLKQKENVVIVNIEDKTTLTLIVDKKIYHIETMDEGTEQIIERIKQKENSNSKAYEICRNTTIYTMEGQDLQDDENEHLNDIIPTLYEIVTKVKQLLEGSLTHYDRILISGTAAMINNIDLYFQEFFKDKKCEILKPYFIKENIKINIKDYVEVNSAIALAMQGLGYGLQEMNFKKSTATEKLPEWLTADIGSKRGRRATKMSFKLDLKKKLDNTEKWLLRLAGGILALTIIYSVFSIFLSDQIQRKIVEVKDVEDDTTAQIALVQADISAIRTKTNRYVELANNLKNTSEQIIESSKNKNRIPTLLSQLMYVIPKDVQVTSVENTSGNHIVINAQSRKYEQLGYFKVKIKTDGILEPDSVVSTQGTKQGDFVKIVIEGDLP